MTSNKPFTGLEVEGPYRGFATLFFPKSSSIKEIQRAIELHPQIRRLYFGAGNDRGITIEQGAFLKDLLEKEKFNVVIEINCILRVEDIPTEIRSKVEIILASDSSDWEASLWRAIQVIKFVTPTKVAWLHFFDTKYCWIDSKINDELYERDKEV